MNGRMLLAKYVPLFALFLFTSCTELSLGTEPITTMTETAMGSLASTAEASQASISIPTSTVTETNIPPPAPTDTPTSHPTLYTVEDWQEPMEEITPANMSRVVKVGTIQFAANIGEFAWSPDGSKLAVETGSGAIVMDAYSLKNMYGDSVVTNDTGRSLAFNSTGDILGIEGSQIDLRTQKVLPGVLFRGGDPLNYQYSPNGDYAAMVDECELQIGSASNTVPPFQIFMSGNPEYLAISPDGKVIAINYYFANYTEFWDPYTHKLINRIKIGGISNEELPRFGKSGDSLYILGAEIIHGAGMSVIQKWDWKKLKPISVQASSLGGELFDVSPSEEVFVFISHEGDLYLQSTNDCGGTIIDTKDKSYFQGARYNNQIFFRPDGKVIAISTVNKNTIDLWGIPVGSSESTETATTSVTPTMVCPSIPTALEHPAASNIQVPC